jgi:hypothetical protein
MREGGKRIWKVLVLKVACNVGRDGRQRGERNRMNGGGKI